MLFSVVVPVYNRPEEIRELLESLTRQTYDQFEVLIVEDGSTITCKQVAEEYRTRLNLRYFFKENSGQGFSRNFGFDKASGEFLVVFDSDCIIPPHYFNTVRHAIESGNIDTWGGPDRAHPTFSVRQKAISYAMTSPLSTGGIRGRSRSLEAFHPRSFNMGISREVYRKTGGYRITRMGEDIDLSIRIKRAGFQISLIEEAFVYHKRRTNLTQFFAQVHFFGRARINIIRLHPDERKLVHLLPALFTLGSILILILMMADVTQYGFLTGIPLLYFVFVFLDALAREKRLSVAIVSIPAVCVQLVGYGTGFLRESAKNLF
ncbi:MAG: glycosyltransferase [Balneolaceae bacterium]